ncbi:hypothetical protein H5410_028222, partial [Solanum commersonii]
MMGDERVGEFHSDEPLEHKLTDNDEMYEDDVDNAPNAPLKIKKILSIQEMMVLSERHFGIQTILNIFSQ